MNRLKHFNSILKMSFSSSSGSGSKPSNFYRKPNSTSNTNSNINSNTNSNNNTTSHGKGKAPMNHQPNQNRNQNQSNSNVISNKKVSPSPIIDIGVNLAHKTFSHTAQAIIQESLATNVSILISTGTSVPDSQKSFQLTQQFPGVVYSTAGVHPHNAKSCHSSTIATLRKIASNPQVVAVGECGLDFDRDFSPRDVQALWFEEQLKLAVELKKPVFLHERKAHETFVQILREHMQHLSGAVVHCFTGTEAELRVYLELGCHIGITGWICDERRGKELADIVHLIPLDRLMIETDAPFLTPRNIHPRPDHNQPCYLPHVLEKVAACMNKTVEEVAEATTATTKKFFSLP